MGESLTLASRSPRRSQILHRLGIPHETIPADIDEDGITGDPAQIARTLAEEKAAAVRPRAATRLLLAADTVVALGNLALGKPRDRSEAKRMLEMLTGRAHEVHTGICVTDLENGTSRSEISTTVVHFSNLTSGEIEWYLDSGEWQTVAGGYRIQGLGGCFIPRIEGSYTGVMGLPIETLYSMLSGYQFTWTDHGPM